MEPFDLKRQPADVLLKLFNGTLEELRRRKIVRSSNNPVGDYAEAVAAHALELTLTGKSGAGHDATDSMGVRYQIKGRRVTPHNKSRLLSAMRNMDSRPFDSLVGIVFDADFEVHRACVVPFDTVLEHVSYSSHVNGHRLNLRDDLWGKAGVVDVTARMAAAASTVLRQMPIE